MGYIYMSTKIDRFVGKHAFLSNFYEHRMVYAGIGVSTAEHAFQMSKATNPEDMRHIASQRTPGLAKRLGRRVTLPDNWEEIKQDVMLDIVRVKFEHPDLRQKLMDTGDAELIEGNSWGDCYWGVCNGVGSNHLGKILMRVRDEIRSDNGL